MPRLTHRLPKLSHHRRSGQAVVTIHGQDYYLGPWKSRVARAEYDRLVGDYVANGNRLPQRRATHFVAELAVAFKKYAAARYVYAAGDDEAGAGKQTGEAQNFDAPLRVLAETHATMLTADFTVAHLKKIQERLSDGRLSRGEVNRRINKIKRIFRWGEAEGLVPPAKYHELSVLLPLARGRTRAYDTQPREPVGEALVAAVLPHMSPTLAAMVQIQLQSGLRPNEVCEMRSCDLDFDEHGTVTIYRPARHKTAHHGHEREAFLDAASTALVRQFIGDDPQAYLFSPADSVRHMQQKRTAARVTPPTQGNTVGTNRVRRPQRLPGSRYTPNTYRQAIIYACRRAFPLPERLAKPSGITHATWVAQLRNTDPSLWGEVEAWDRAHRFFPYQLRHAAATRWRKTMSPDIVLTLLGDRSTNMVDLYAKRDRAAAVSALQHAAM